MEEDLIFIKKMTYFLKNERQPNFFENERRPKKKEGILTNSNTGNLTNKTTKNKLAHLKNQP